LKISIRQFKVISPCLGYPNFKKVYKLRIFVNCLAAWRRGYCTHWDGSLDLKPSKSCEIYLEIYLKKIYIVCDTRFKRAL